LTRIDVDESNPNYSSSDGVLYNKAMTTLIQYSAGKSGGFIIPNSVTSIGRGAFTNCAVLTSVTIPNSVTSIESAAFTYCSGLIAVYFFGNAPTMGVMFLGVLQADLQFTILSEPQGLAIRGVQHTAILLRFLLM
jgi:hypothetical protein